MTTTQLTLPGVGAVPAAFSSAPTLRPGQPPPHIPSPSFARLRRLERERERRAERRAERAFLEVGTSSPRAEVLLLDLYQPRLVPGFAVCTACAGVRVDGACATCEDEVRQGGSPAWHPAATPPAFTPWSVAS